MMHSKKNTHTYIYIYIVTRNNSNVSSDKEPDFETTLQVEKSKN